VNLVDRDIICLSTHYWDDRWFRKQEFMSRFARRNRVLYVEPSFSMVRGPDNHLAGIATNRFVGGRLERRSENVHLLKPPRALPKWNHPRVDRVTYRRFGRTISQTAQHLGLRRPILWIYNPSYYQALDLIPHDRVVFDLVDDLAAYTGEGNARAIYDEASVDGLIRRCDLLIVTAKTLAERYGALATRLELVPNGFDAQLFTHGDSTPTHIDSLQGLRRPLLGFVGTLFVFIDYDLLEQVARAHPDKTLVLVGRVEGCQTQVRRLCKLGNVVHLGQQPRASIPGYMSAFDVCLNPFRVGRVADSVSPLKVYEYLATGRPVVSTPMRALQMEDAGQVVHFAQSAEDFCRQIDQCLTLDVQRAAKVRQEAVAGNSWERLFERVDRAAQEVAGA
jgi:glycosyltransferase involved in cell wall biosynthesis